MCWIRIRRQNPCLVSGSGDRFRPGLMMNEVWEKIGRARREWFMMRFAWENAQMMHLLWWENWLNGIGFGRIAFATVRTERQLVQCFHKSFLFIDHSFSDVDSNGDTCTADASKHSELISMFISTMLTWLAVVSTQAFPFFNSQLDSFSPLVNLIPLSCQIFFHAHYNTHSNSF